MFDRFSGVKDKVRQAHFPFDVSSNLLWEGYF